MRRVQLNPQNPQACFREIERASHENDVLDIAQAFSFTGTPVQTTTLNVSAPTLANTNAVLATLLQIMQKGGLHRTT
jgi:hypothetical protein